MKYDVYYIASLLNEYGERFKRNPLSVDRAIIKKYVEYTLSPKAFSNSFRNIVDIQINSVIDTGGGFPTIEYVIFYRDKYETVSITKYMYVFYYILFEYKDLDLELIRTVIEFTQSLNKIYKMPKALWVEDKFLEAALDYMSMNPNISDECKLFLKLYK